MPPGTPFVNPKAKAKERLILVGVMVGILWLLYLIRAVFDFDLVGYLHHDSSNPRLNESMPAIAYLILAIVGTIAGILWMVVKNKGTVNLAKNGVRVEGRVIKIGMLSKGGMVPVTIVYDVKGTERRLRMDIPKASDKCQEGAVVTVVYDPDNPRRAEVF